MGALIDTNVLVYALDLKNPKKRAIAKSILESVFNGHRHDFVSNQNLAEFYSVIAGKLKTMDSKQKAMRLISAISASNRWGKVNYTFKTVQNASELQAKTNASFWDTLIVQTMLENGIDEIITENAPDFKSFPGIRVKNPFG
jgi:predicted nucleic acid-binding protein